ncbi:MAG: SseB family protein [Geopsychrobacter sp.]|nr:SseB family protein [Geopsychrobacter sp.]
MTELDTAFDALRTAPDDREAQSGFYDLFLNSSFFVPTVQENLSMDEEDGDQETEVPLIVENNGTDYLVLFDLQQRLNDWAEQEAPFVKLPGHLIAEMTTPELNWALNIGTDHSKLFAPDEIDWLKDVVVRCKAEGEGNTEG